MPDTVNCVISVLQAAVMEKPTNLSALLADEQTLEGTDPRPNSRTTLMTLQQGGHSYDAIVCPSPSPELPRLTSGSTHGPTTPRPPTAAPYVSKGSWPIR